ncbi:hypothetical protein [Bacterioplanes sanyensis]|uniref:hypothetical protein n=1 Tax=Bacterioplanes sanyensis TaxID=1249553 RepID=UPI0016734DB3|nr:hypothetical protein [Bacterioplanes sanyensis]
MAVEKNVGFKNMGKKSSIMIYLLCLVTIAVQAVIFHAWNTGVLDQFQALHHSFDNQTPEMVQYGIKTAKHWWLAPLFSMFLLSLASFISNRSKLVFLPLVVSVGLATYMLYVMYPIPHLIKLG